MKSLLKPYVKNADCNILSKNYKTMMEASTLFCRMAENVERHKIEIIKLIDEAKTRGIIDDGILKMLDTSVDLMLGTIKELSLTPKDQCSGLGAHIIPQLIVVDSPIELAKDTVIPPIIDSMQLQLQQKAVQYGKLSCYSNKCCGSDYSSRSVGVNSLGYCDPFCMYVSLIHKEIVIKYKIVTGPFAGKELCFPITWSGNIDINPSSIVCQTEVVGCERDFVMPTLVNISVNDFIDRMLRELKSLSALSGIFVSEQTKLCSCAKEFRVQSATMACIDPSCCCAEPC